MQPNPTWKLVGLPKLTHWCKGWLFYLTQTGVSYMDWVLGLVKPNSNRPMYTPNQLDVRVILLNNPITNIWTIKVILLIKPHHQFIINP